MRPRIACSMALVVIPLAAGATAKEASVTQGGLHAGSAAARAEPTGDPGLGPAASGTGPVADEAEPRPAPGAPATGARPDQANLASPPQAPPPDAPLPALYLPPRIYVADAGNLAELVKEDPELSSRAQALVGRQFAAYAVAGVGAVVGSILIFTGLGNQSCSNDPRFDGLRVCSVDPTQSSVGMGTLVGSLLLGAIIAPGRSDFLDVLNQWNMAHPDRQAELYRSYPWYNH